MAALSEQALVLATEKQDEQSRLVGLQVDDHFNFSLIKPITDQTGSMFCAVPGLYPWFLVLFVFVCQHIIV